jgi:aminoacrylate hydrolase
MPEFIRDAATIHYEIEGSGPPLLLLAGTASDSASWGPLLRLLPGRQLLLIDNRGSGRTKVEGPLAIGDLVDDAAALLEHLGVASADVVGHSLGGYLSLCLAAQYPEKVRRVVTLAAGTISAKERVLFRDMARLYPTILPQDWFRLFYQWLFSQAFFAEPGRIEVAAEASATYAYRQSPGDFARQVAAIDNFKGIDISPVSCPVLAIAAELDLLAPPSAVAAAHVAIADYEMITIEDAAHSIHWEKPVEVAAAIVEFLGRV